jgi:hypothetical protein
MTRFFITVGQLRVCWCGALSLTRGWVCCLQLLLALASAVIFGSESRGTRDHILLSEIRDISFRHLLRLAGLRCRYSTPPPHGMTLGQVKVKVTSRLTVGQSISKSWCRAPSGAPSMTRGRVCLLYMLLAPASVVFLGSESLGTRGHILLYQIWDFPFGRLLQLAGSGWKYSNSPPHGWLSDAQPARIHRYTASGRDQQKTQPLTYLHFCYERLPSNSSDTVDVFTGRYRATHVSSRWLHSNGTTRSQYHSLSQPSSYKSDAFPLQNIKLLTALP